jgi:ribosomal protein S18 acetylase RimI-like enzyme
MNVSLSALDLQRFGHVTAKADGLEAVADVDACLSFCTEHDARLLIARVDTPHLEVAHAIENAGGILCDTLIYYELRLRATAPEAALRDADFTVRRIMSADRAEVLAIAREAFSDYYGHYHSDPRLDRDASDETYVSWCESTIDQAGDVFDVLVIEDAGTICGFLTLRVHDDARLELVLSGIRKQYSGRGVYRRLIEAGVRYAVARKLKRVFTSTQIPNLAVQWTWISQGFLPVKSTHTFHVWFDSPDT